MRKPGSLIRVAVAAVALPACMAVTTPAVADSVPSTPRYEPAGAGKWVLKIDPQQYGGAQGTITFYDDSYRGPGGASVNDFKIGDGFDAKQVAFVQDVRVARADGLTTDPPSSPISDGGSPTLSFGDANMDGAVNLGPFAWTTPPDTRFMNMGIDRSGNYHVARKDMIWGFFDTFDYHKTGSKSATPEDTQFNFQPYPLSDAFGWCGSVLASQPEAVERQAGQLVFDIAFDVYPLNAKPGGPIRPMTQVVPGFVMRSYGRYDVDVTWAFGRQAFAGSTTGNNTNPITRRLDAAWKDKVSPLGAGVVPSGAWVLDDGKPTMRVVSKDTPGATWHTNTFAGAAFLLRGDVLRTVHLRNGVDYLDARQWTNWPLLARAKSKPTITVDRVARRGSRLLVDGRLAGAGRVTVQLAGTARGARRSAVAPLRFGRFRAALPIPGTPARTTTVVVRYGGDRNNLAETARRFVRVR